MPSFTATQPNLRNDGPIVSVQLAIPQAVAIGLTAGGGTAPQPVPAQALIDTGASNTVIQAGIAARLGLNPVGVTNITTPSSVNVPCPLFALRIVFPNGVTADPVTVIEAPLQGQNIECLIGRDLLSQAVLVYIGYSNQWTISF